jgi:tetratricopeptide (TPR) repeat protein
MLKKILPLFFVLSSLFFFGCSTRTVDIQRDLSIEEGKSVFDEFGFSEIYVKFHQDGNGIDYDEVSTLPFPKDEIDKIYSSNAIAIKNGLEDQGLADCLRIEESGKFEQCYSEKRKTIFSKNSPNIISDPIGGIVDIAFLPLISVLGVLDHLSDNLSASGVNDSLVHDAVDMDLLVHDVVDMESMAKYSQFLVYKISADLEASKVDFKSYKTFLLDTTLISLSKKSMIDQLRKFGTEEAYDLAYDMSLFERDLEKAYPAITDIDSFLANPRQANLVFGGTSNCFSVNVSALNVRNKPTVRGSKVVGKYNKGDLVCSLDEKNDWIKSEKGWVSKEFLKSQRKSNEGNLAVKIAKVEEMKKMHDLQASLKTNSVANYEKYIKTYGKEEKVDVRLQALYRQQGKVTKNADMFKKSYEVSANDDDVKNYIQYANLKTVRAEYKSSSFIKSESHRNLLKASLVERLRKLGTLASITEAHQYSRDPDDLRQVLSLTASVGGLESFVSTYKKDSNKEIVNSAKRKLVALYRERGSFADYLSAYELLSEAQDAENALKRASSLHEKSLLEKAAFEQIPHKEALVRAAITCGSASYDDHKISRMGLLSQHSFSGNVYPSGCLDVAFEKGAAFEPSYGVYKVTVEVKATVPRNKQVRSSWVGNEDKSADLHKTHKVTFTLRPPYNSVESSFKIGEMGFVYFDRGSNGGYTAIWPSDNAYLAIKDISVEYVGEASAGDRDLDIDFASLAKLSPSINRSKFYVDGSYSKGMAVLMKFSDLDEDALNRYRDL